MGFLDWWGQNWFNLLQTIVLTGGLVFTGLALRDETRERRIANLLTLTENHREIWTNLFEFPELAHVLDESADLAKNPTNTKERLFVTLVIHHLHSTFQSMKNDLVIKPESLCRDVAAFFRLPIPGSVWTQLKHLQDDDFVAFVESCSESKRKF